jgi:outer membrane protein OmpA-like peptidoglycan-associated protein
MAHTFPPSTTRVRRTLALACAATLVSSSLVLAQIAPAPAPPPTPIAFEAALMKAATDLFSKANLEGMPNKIQLAIDPLIDGFTGAQSAATQMMEKRIVEMVRSNYDRFEVTPFTTDVVTNMPVVLIGTFTAINNAGVAGGPRDAYRICLALADLKARKIISKGVARAIPEGIDATPVAFFKDSPVFTKDAAIGAYIKSCQGTKMGDAIDPMYADRILASALVTEATEAYAGKRYKEALELYQSASHIPGGQQLRVLNGIYLSNWRLNRPAAAAESFGKLVDFGLKGDKLAVSFLFRPGSTQYMADRDTRQQYGMWTKQIARQAAKADKCLEVVGHTSATGPAAVNERLSAQRAEYVKARMVDAMPGAKAGQRFAAKGMGSQELIVGTAKDDASDALDRRVEFKTMACPAPTAGQDKLDNSKPVEKVVTKPKRQASGSLRPASNDLGTMIQSYINTTSYKALLQ